MANDRGTIREDLQWFVDNLELQLEDEELLRKGVQVLHYWDTADIRRSVLGLEDLIVHDGFDIDELSKDRTLATCLASDGWLGTIQMLEPHQAEFVKSLRSGFGLEGRVLSPKQINRFFETLGFSSDTDLQLTGFSRKPAPERNRITRRYAGKAAQLFKAIQCSNGNWRTRLASMYSNSRLEFSTTTTDYSGMFSSTLFREMRHRFSDMRAGRSINNIADAACICILENQLSNYSFTAGSSIPRFFDSGGVFTSVVNRDAGDRTLKYDGPDGKTRSVLRDWNYYILKATFNNSKVAQEAGTSSLEALRSVHGTATEMLKASSTISSDLVDRIRVGDRSLSAVIQDLRRYWFLESVWLPFAASDSINNASTTLEYLHVDSARSKSFLASVNKAIEDATKTLESNSSNYKWYRDFWTTVGDSARTLRVRLRGRLIQVESLYRILGIARFGVPIDYRSQIEVLIEGLVSGEEESIRRELTLLSKLCAVGRDRIAIKERTVVISVLWALDMHDKMRDLEIDFKEESTWLVGIATASAIRSGREKEGIHGLRELESRYKNRKTGLTDGDAATLLAYLNFQVWRQGGGLAFWEATSHNASVDRNRDSLRRSIDLARSSTGLFEHDDEKRAYALNLELFYLSEGGTPEEFLRAEEVSLKLRRFHNIPNVWQYKYDDSLSRYFYRRSTLASKIEEQEAFRRSALRYSNYAIAASPGDVRVDDFNSFLAEKLSPL